MPTKKPKKKTKAELHEEIGYDLMRAQMRLELVSDLPVQKVGKAEKFAIRQALMAVKRSHRAFHELIGKKRK